MTSSQHTSSINIGNDFAHHLSTSNHPVNSAQCIVSMNERNSVTEQSNNLLSQEQSCLTSLNKWCRDVCRRVRCTANETNEQTEIHLTEVNKSIRENRTIEQGNLFPLRRAHRTIKITDKSSVSLACNDRHILLKQTPHLCLLDTQLHIVKEIPWAYDHVDMCWSSTLERFIIVAEDALFTLDEQTMTLDRCLIYLNKEKQWSCGTCSDTSLYLSTVDMSTCLYQYTLQPLIQFVKEWQLVDLHPTHEGILSIICKQEQLALIISNIHTFQRRLELRSILTLERLWFIALDTVAHCCSIKTNQWLVMELLKPRLLHISSDGKILQEFVVKPSSINIIWNAVQLADDTIVTLTMANLNLHKLS